MLFSKFRRNDSPRHERVYALYELAYTLVDFGAAGCFVAGSVMFLYEPWKHTGTWLFIAGSVLFAMKPTIRLVRELRLAAIGDAKNLAKKVED